MNDSDAILAFWLHPKPTTAAESEAAWDEWFFKSSPELDRTITERFGPLLERARRRELEDWRASPHGTLALGRESTPEEVEYLAYLKAVGQWL